MRLFMGQNNTQLPSGRKQSSHSGMRSALAILLKINLKIWIRHGRPHQILHPFTQVNPTDAPIAPGSASSH